MNGGHRFAGFPVKPLQRSSRADESRTPAADAGGAGGGGPSRVRIDYRTEHQKFDKWCWAAVSTSVSKFFDAASPWTQCAVASEQLAPARCCQDGPSCNRYGYLNRALATTGNLVDWFEGPIDGERIEERLSTGAPVAVRIEWPDRTGHFVAISAYDRDSDGDEHVVVSDPMFSAGSMPLASMTTDYLGKRGAWTHTYFTGPAT